MTQFVAIKPSPAVSGQVVIEAVREVIATKSQRLYLRNDRHPDSRNATGYFHIMDVGDGCIVGQASAFACSHIVVAPALENDLIIKPDSYYDLLVVQQYKWPDVESTVVQFASAAERDRAIGADIVQFAADLYRILGANLPPS